MIVTVLGWVAAVVGPSVSLPQIVRLVRAKVTDGVSLLLWQLTLAAVIAWTIHGLKTAQANLVATNIVATTFAAIVLWLLWRGRGLRWWWAFLCPALLGLALGAVDGHIPAAAFGLVLLAPALMGQAGQGRDLFRSASIAGVSVGYLGLNLVCQTLWLTWSLLVGDAAIQWCAGATGAATLVNLVLWLLRRTGALRGPAAASQPSNPPLDQ